jgi:hypothetical protein
MNMMKKIILKLMALFIVACVSLSCDSSKDISEDGEFTEPVEISFTEYSLVGTLCQWTNLAYDGKIIIINSNKELEKYVECSNSSYPAIDFSKYTLLLVGGGVAGGIGTLSKKVLLSSNKLILEIEIIFNDAAIAGENWILALLTEKIDTDIKMELNVKTTKN